MPEPDDSAATGNIPIPDPSLMTTKQLQREVFSLRELLETRLLGGEHSNELIRNIIETRLDGMDKAIKLLQDTADKFPARIDEKITALREVHEERFKSVDKQFSERDVRTDKAAEASTTAVNAALQAQKESAGKQAEAFQEATSKSEQQFTKQIDQQGELLKTEVRALVTQINELKDRFNRGEGKGEGSSTTMTTQRAANSYMIAVIGLIIAFCGLAAGIAIAVLRHP